MTTAFGPCRVCSNQFLNEVSDHYGDRLICTICGREANTVLLVEDLEDYSLKRAPGGKPQLYSFSPEISTYGSQSPQRRDYPDGKTFQAAYHRWYHVNVTKPKRQRRY